ncbi:lipopolysaccharide biosynthesis protein [Kineococcus auxinigenes]|uniref:lipopolysaccharide biosynthesis protein n=1 Tax=unclassified Kineococcus TaxID=2621656 RepID=UPI003D7E6503
MAAQIWTVRSMSVVSFVVVGRQLEPAAFGLVALAGGIIGVLAILSDSGMATYLIRQQQLDETTRSTAFWTSLGLACTLAVLLAACAPLIAAAFDEPELTVVLWCLTLNLVLAGGSSVPNALMRRELRFKALAARGTAAAMTGAVLAIALAVAGAGVWALVAQSIGQAVVSAVMLWCAVDWRPTLQIERRRAREMLSFGSKLLTIDLLMQARDRGEEFVLAGVASTTTLGFWTVATRLVKLIQDTGSQVISSVTTPAFAKLQSDLPRLFRAYETAMSATGVVIFPAMLFLAATSPDVVPLVLGEQWTRTALVAQITAVTAAIGVFSYFDRTIFVAVGKLRPEMIMVALIITLHLVVVVTLAPLGLTAMALGLLGRALFTFPVRQVVLHRVVGVPYRCLLKPFRVFAAAALMALLVWGGGQVLPWEDRWARFGAYAGIAALTYPLLLLLLARPVALDFGGELKRLLAGRLRRGARASGPSQAQEPSATVRPTDSSKV